jgi:hypothetical protein
MTNRATRLREPMTETAKLSEIPDRKESTKVRETDSTA